MHYVTTLPERLKDWAKGALHLDGTPMHFRVFWEFGAPGHGKGVWDGIGAWMKRTVRQDITDHRPGKNITVLTKSGHILSPCEVSEHLQKRFNTGIHIDVHAYAHAHACHVYISMYMHMHMYMLAIMGLPASPAP